MDKAKQLEIARRGGIAAHRSGRAHEFTPEEARIAGRKGGNIVSRNRAHMVEIGRKGGTARGIQARREKELNRSATSCVTA
jgi:general stress protein YciG